MRSNPYQAYVQNEILTAGPVRLVQLMYRAALEAVDSARANLARGDVMARSAAVSKAVEILNELSSSLDHQQGGEISARLAALYDYIQRLLLTAHSQQSDVPFAEAARLLSTLEEAWLSISPAEAAAPEQEAAVCVPAGYEPLSCAY